MYIMFDIYNVWILPATNGLLSTYMRHYSIFVDMCEYYNLFDKGQLVFMQNIFSFLKN